MEQIKDLENKDEKELLNIIQNTLNDINKISEKNKMSNLYFETMNKAIDLKLLENDAKMIKDAYDKNGSSAGKITKPGFVRRIGQNRKRGKRDFVPLKGAFIAVGESGTQSLLCF